MKLVSKPYKDIPHKGFELSIIESWKNWDEMDVMANIFYEAPLLIDIGPYKKGDILPWISVDLQRGIVEIPTKEDEDKSLSFQIVIDTITVE